MKSVIGELCFLKTLFFIPKYKNNIHINFLIRYFFFHFNVTFIIISCFSKYENARHFSIYLGIQKGVLFVD